MFLPKLFGNKKGCLPQKPGAIALGFTVNTPDGLFPAYAKKRLVTVDVGAVSYVCGPLIK